MVKYVVKCIITVSTCGVDSLYSLKLYGIQITIKCIQTSETDRLTLSLWNGKSYVLSNCFHWELTLCALSTQSAGSTLLIIAYFYIVYESNFDTAIKICFILAGNYIFPYILWEKFLFCYLSRCQNFSRLVSLQTSWESTLEISSIHLQKLLKY